ncbi:inner centromere protein A isoform X2 [Uranotaenia lowii]|uniref:inner centromere protein A isoform X2 n=1 Tax=Uranotaenia lowii TaxID=190385 RepID=UPI0024787F45|nr:inner centromere protein A isoform X2 [Uranotaenia lowii]
MKERQNEERQRKLEELKAQALAAQKFREQKEEERRRRMEDLRKRENDRRSQVEERRRAIQEADNERRQYILQKNQERDQRMEAKRRNERSSIVFAFGSSTPRMLETADSGMCSSFWANRRATSITNVAYTGAPLTRRSSERELTDGSSKKRATSASGLDRSTDDDSGDMSYQRTVNRRKTDLMPTIPSPRDSSRSSLGTHTPRTPGRAFSMTRLDQLAQPLRRNGEHISAIVERERRQALDPDNTQLSLSSSRSSPTADSSSKRMSRSMSQLASAGTSSSTSTRRHIRNTSQDSQQGRGVRKSSFNASGSGSDSPMGRADTSKSMSQLNTAGRSGASRVTRTERLRQQLNGSFGGQQQHNGGFSPNATGLRSGEITPNNGLSGSRPGSAMSTSTTASGVVYRRSLPSSAGSHQRKPRPISIAVTGVSMGPKEEKPPLPKPSSAGSNNSSSTGLERKRSQQSGTSTPAKPPSGSASTVEGGHHKKPSSERIQRVPSIGNRSSHSTPKASSTPLQSPGPDKANRTLQDSLQQQHKEKVKKQLPVDDQPKQPLSKQGSSVSAKSTEEKPVEINEPTKVQQQPPQLPEPLSVQSETVTPVAVETAIELQNQQPSQPEQQQQIIVTETKTEEVHTELLSEEKPQILEQSHHEEKRDETKEDTTVTSGNLELSVQDGSTGDLMTASMIAKKITTEEEAKAALAERRRLAREEAERQAELERQRIAAEEAAEQQRQFEEEERLRKLEEESIRLAEEQRRLEEERLEQAIQEAQKRDEEEKQRREEEARQKVEREEQERKAREEAERQRVEMAERLKKEEKEREERRKRVEAIMSRTRTKGSANNTPTKQTEEASKESAMSKSVIVSSSNPSVADSSLLMTNSVMLGTGSLDQVAAETGAPSEKPSSPSLEQAVQSLSLNSVEEHDDAASNSINNNNDSTSVNNNHSNNNDRMNYEQSVTEKENLLLGSFNNNSSNAGGADNSSSSSNSSSLQPSSLESSGSVLPAVATTNGKSTPGATSIAETTELIIEDAIMAGQTNGHKNGSIDNVFAQSEPIVADSSNNNNTGAAKFLAQFETPVTAPSFFEQEALEQQHNQQPESMVFAERITTGSANQLIDFASLQSEEGSKPTAPIFNDGNPFAISSNINNNNNNHIDLFDTGSSGDTTTNPFATDLIDTTATVTSSNSSSSNINDITNLISNSNFLNNNTNNSSNNTTNSTRLVAAATSDSQDNRDLSLL